MNLVDNVAFNENIADSKSQSTPIGTGEEVDEEALDIVESVINNDENIALTSRPMTTKSQDAQRFLKMSTARNRSKLRSDKKHVHDMLSSVVRRPLRKYRNEDDDEYLNDFIEESASRR